MQTAAQRLVDQMVALDPRSPAFADLVARLSATGRAELRESGDLSERCAARWATGTHGTVPVARALGATREALSGIDPPPRGLRRLLARREEDPDRLTARLLAARPVVEESLRSLTTALDALRREVAETDADIAALADVGDRLQERADVLGEVEAGLTAHAVEARSTATARRGEILAQGAVCAQAALAVTTVRANSVALVEAADRARRMTAGLLSATTATERIAALGDALGDVDAALGAVERGR